MRPLLISVRDAALLLGVSPRTITRLIEQQVLPNVKIKRRRMVTMAGLVDMAAKGTSVELLKRVQAGIGTGRTHD